MRSNDSKMDDASDLSRYRQAADIAYQYAKNKVERERAPKTEPNQEDVFGASNKQES